MELDPYKPSLTIGYEQQTDEWWQNAMRSVLAAAHDHYQAQVADVSLPPDADEIRRRHDAASDRILAKIKERSGGDDADLQWRAPDRVSDHLCDGHFLWPRVIDYEVQQSLC